MPILSNKEIEDDAEMFIRDFDADLLKNPREVDIEQFAEYYLGLTPEYNNLTHCGLILGRMVFNDSDKIPVYNPDSHTAEYISAKKGTVMIDNTLLDNEHRFRSTMGHESGHWIYHSAYFHVDPYQMTLFDTGDKTSTACRKSDIEGADCPEGGKKVLTSDHDWIEHHAKYFSAAILMPRAAMQIICGDQAYRAVLRSECPNFEEEVLAAHVSEVFNVSMESAKIRIKQLGYGFEKVAVSSIFTIGYPSRIFSL